jgi:L-iditol 2-dehydrogenase
MNALESTAPAPTAAPSDGVRTMRAAILNGVARMEVGEVPRPVPAPFEVLLRVQAVGLCGTDLHIFLGHANYHRDAEGRVVPPEVRPQVLGHEIAGIVEEVGSDVNDLRPGDRVIVDQARSCVGERRLPVCEYCESGDSHQCDHFREHGITGLQGGLAEFIAVPAANCVALGTDLDPARAALVEPLGCIAHAMEMVMDAAARFRFDAERPERRIAAVLVCGAGPSGLLFIQYLRRVMGYEGQLLVSEPNPAKRALGERFGAEGIDPAATDVVEAVRSRTGGRGVELLIDAAAAGEVFRQMPSLIRKQATVLLYGHGHTGVELAVLNHVQVREPTLLAPCGASGGFDTDGRPSTYRRALRLVEDGVIEVEPMITHRYGSLEEVPGAFAHDHRLPDYVKGVYVAPVG